MENILCVLLKDHRLFSLLDVRSRCLQKVKIFVQDYTPRSGVADEQTQPCAFPPPAGFLRAPTTFQLL